MYSYVNVCIYVFVYVYIYKKYLNLTYPFHTYLFIDELVFDCRFYPISYNQKHSDYYM